MARTPYLAGRRFKQIVQGACSLFSRHSVRTSVVPVTVHFALTIQINGTVLFAY